MRSYRSYYEKNPVDSWTPPTIPPHDTLSLWSTSYVDNVEKAESCNYYCENSTTCGAFSYSSETLQCLQNRIAVLFRVDGRSLSGQDLYEDRHGKLATAASWYAIDKLLKDPAIEGSWYTGCSPLVCPMSTSGYMPVIRADGHYSNWYANCSYPPYGKAYCSLNTCCKITALTARAV